MTDCKTWIDRQITSFCDTFKLPSKEYIETIYKKMLFQDGSLVRFSLTNTVYLTYEISKCKLSIVNLKTKQRGSATLKKGDQFDLLSGVAIAWARYRNRPIHGKFLCISGSEIEKPQTYSAFRKLMGKPILFTYHRDNKDTLFDMRDFQLNEDNCIEHKYLPLDVVELYKGSFYYRYAEVK